MITSEPKTSIAYSARFLLLFYFSIFFDSNIVMRYLDAYNEHREARSGNPVARHVSQCIDFV